MVSSSFPVKNEQSLSLVIKGNTMDHSQEVSWPRFITSTDVKNSQFNLLVMQPKPNKSIGLIEYKATSVGLDLNQVMTLI